MKTTMKTEICAARMGLLVLMEELGAAAGLLREASDDCEGGNVGGARMCCDDVVEMMATIESKAAGIGAALCRWVEVGEGSTAAVCAACGGLSMMEGIGPDDDVMNTPCGECNTEGLASPADNATPKP
jgi:hypothetical protein